MWLHLKHVLTSGWSVVYEALQYIVSPPYCSHCWKFVPHRVPLCVSCESMIRAVVSYDIVVRSHMTCTVHAVSSYEEPVRSLIRAKQSRSIVASYQLGYLLNKKLYSLICLPQDVLIPVPLHWQRYAWRGFNQGEIIATCLAKQRNTTITHLIKRIKRTKYQASTISKDERWTNVEDAFVWNIRYNPHDFLNKRIVIVDDLMTTGATIRAMVEEICRTFKKHRLPVPKIIACVAARVI